ncbi:NUDIX domain-containing protein [Marinomonas sp. MED121]|uniref:NUDIX domain-containing protein n=1 Tax=Marinomonas sp. MED121 TaxID=314277 RepID=UPI00031CFC33|nr:NUDIX domain-containing protein [Marinomonas sp. MED121]
MSNTKVKILKRLVLSKCWYTYSKYSYRYRTKDTPWRIQHREVLNKGDGAAVLLFNYSRKTVVLVKQFRLPTYLNANSSGLMIEVCAGVLDGMSPEECIKKETLEETGFRIENPEPVMTVYMSPGAVTEKNHLFVADYSSVGRPSLGGGLASENEYIEVLELSFEQAYSMLESGEIIDGKTIMLLQYAKLNIFFD